VPTGLRVEVFVADLDRAVDFYARVLGFALARRDPGGADGTRPYASLARGAVAVGALEVGDRAAGVAPALRRPWTGVELVLEVDDVGAARDHAVGSGWPLEEDLVARPWGLTDFRLLDPDGYYWRVTHR
jgi:lactoylglutathione lyase